MSFIQNLSRRLYRTLLEDDALNKKLMKSTPLLAAQLDHNLYIFEECLRDLQMHEWYWEIRLLRQLVWIVFAYIRKNSKLCKLQPNARDFQRILSETPSTMFSFSLDCLRLSYLSDLSYAELTYKIYESVFTCVRSASRTHRYLFIRPADSAVHFFLSSDDLNVSHLDRKLDYYIDMGLVQKQKSHWNDLIKHIFFILFFQDSSPLLAPCVSSLVLEYLIHVDYLHAANIMVTRVKQKEC